MYNALSYMLGGAFRCLLFRGHFWKAVVSPGRYAVGGVALSKNAIKQLGAWSLFIRGVSVLYSVNKNEGDVFRGCLRYAGPQIRARE